VLRDDDLLALLYAVEVLAEIVLQISHADFGT